MAWLLRAFPLRRGPEIIPACSAVTASEDLKGEFRDHSDLARALPAMSSSVWTNVLISPRAGEAPEEVSDLLTVEEEMTATEMLRRLDFEEKHLCHLHEDLTSALTPERSRRSIATPDSPSSVLSHTPVVHRQLFPSQFSTPERNLFN